MRKPPCHCTVSESLEFEEHVLKTPNCFYRHELRNIPEWAKWYGVVHKLSWKLRRQRILHVADTSSSGQENQT